MQAHFGAAAGPGADADFRPDFFRALVHHAQADMLTGLGFGAAFRVEALPVVAHGHGEAVAVFQQHFGLPRGGVFADIGQGFLQNKQRLCLLLAVEQAVAAANVQHHGNAGLLAAALDDTAHGFGEVAVLRFGTEMVEQFAHVFVAILDAVANHLDVVAHGFVVRQ